MSETPSETSKPDETTEPERRVEVNIRASEGTDTATVMSAAEQVMLSDLPAVVIQLQRPRLEGDTNVMEFNITALRLPMRQEDWNPEGIREYLGGMLRLLGGSFVDESTVVERDEMIPYGDSDEAPTIVDVKSPLL